MKLRISGTLEIKPFGESPPLLFIGEGKPLVALVRNVVDGALLVHFRVKAGEDELSFNAVDLKAEVVIHSAGPFRPLESIEVLKLGGADIVPWLREHVGQQCEIKIEILK